MSWPSSVRVTPEGKQLFCYYFLYQSNNQWINQSIISQSFDWSVIQSVSRSFSQWVTIPARNLETVCASEFHLPPWIGERGVSSNNVAPVGIPTRNLETVCASEPPTPLPLFNVVSDTKMFYFGQHWIGEQGVSRNCGPGCSQSVRQSVGHSNNQPVKESL